MTVTKEELKDIHKPSPSGITADLKFKIRARRAWNKVTSLEIVQMPTQTTLLANNLIIIQGERKAFQQNK